MPVSDEVRRIAEEQAAGDRELLATLVREGKVVRTRTSPDQFVLDIQGRAFPKRQINLAIRPKRKKGRR